MVFLIGGKVLFQRPSTNYSDTATVKAIAIKDGQSSQMASKTFTKSSGNDDDDLIQN